LPTVDFLFLNPSARLCPELFKIDIGKFSSRNKVPVSAIMKRGPFVRDSVAPLKGALDMSEKRSLSIRFSASDETINRNNGDQPVYLIGNGARDKFLSGAAQSGNQNSAVGLRYTPPELNL